MTASDMPPDSSVSSSTPAQRPSFQAWQPSLYTALDGQTSCCWRPRYSSSLTKRFSFHLPMSRASLAARHRRLADKRVVQHLPGWGAEPEGGIEETWKEIVDMNTDPARLAFDIQQRLPGDGRELTEDEREYLVQPAEGGAAYLAAGEIGILRYEPAENRAEVGILLSPFSQGKGLLTEAMHYMLSVAFAPSPSSSEANPSSWAADYTFQFPTTLPPASQGLNNERAGLALSSIIIGTATTNTSMTGFAQHVLGARELSKEEMTEQQRKVDEEWKAQGSGLVVFVLTREAWGKNKIEERLRTKILQKKQG